LRRNEITPRAQERFKEFVQGDREAGREKGNSLKSLLSISCSPCKTSNSRTALGLLETGGSPSAFPRGQESWNRFIRVAAYLMPRLCWGNPNHGWHARCPPISRLSFARRSGMWTGSRTVWSSRAPRRAHHPGRCRGQRGGLSRSRARFARKRAG